MDDLDIAAEDLKLLTAQQAWHYRAIPQCDGGLVRCHTDREVPGADTAEELGLTSRRSGCPRMGASISGMAASGWTSGFPSYPR